jgi:amidase
VTELVPGPFVSWLEGRPPRPASGTGPLAGLRLAVKDLVDVAGLPTGAGHPAWLATHAAATRDAPVVAALLAAGASLAGKTHTDELAFSLFGSNAHYGAPDNPAAPGHLTGGSSSGTAAAVAAGLADLGLGTDTGGSVRVPAGWCGLFGLRPSHDRVSRAGIVPLCGSFDVPGLLATRLDVLTTAAGVLLAGSPEPDQRLAPERPRRLNAPPDLWALAAPAVQAALAPAVDRLRDVLPVHSEPLFGSAPPDYRAGYSARTGWEFWRAHGAWVQAERPEFGPGVSQRVRAAAAVTAATLAAGDQELAQTRAALDRALAGGTVLVLPTAPQPAPPRGADTRPLRAPILGLTALASVAGLPGLTVPGAQVAGRPVGLSLVGPVGADETLLDLARVLA